MRNIILASLLLSVMLVIFLTLLQSLHTRPARQEQNLLPDIVTQPQNIKPEQKRRAEMKKLLQKGSLYQAANLTGLSNAGLKNASLRQEEKPNEETDKGITSGEIRVLSGYQSDELVVINNKPFIRKGEKHTNSIADLLFRKKLLHGTRIISKRKIWKVKDNSIILKREPGLQNWQKTARALHYQILNFRREHYGRRISVVIRDFASGNTIHYKPMQRFFGASMLKIYVMLAVYEKAERMATFCREMRSRRERYGSRHSKYRQANRRMHESGLVIREREENYLDNIKLYGKKIKTLGNRIGKLEQYMHRLDNLVAPMISKSENFPVHWFRTHLGDRFFREYLESLNLAQTRWTTHMRCTSAGDLTHIFNRILEKNLFRNEYYNTRCLKLLNATKRKGLGTRLPSWIPVAQKRGLWNGDHSQERHTTGIVYTPKGKVIISIMTASVPEDGDPAFINRATRLFGDIAWLVYAFNYQ